MEWRCIVLMITTNRYYEFHLMQLSDSFFPSGMFGMSGGLESFVKSGRIRNEKHILRFIKNQLCFQLVPCDCIALSIAMDASYDNDLSSAANIDNTYYSMKLVSEVRTASVRSGQQILICLSQMVSAKTLGSATDSILLNINRDSINFLKRFLREIKMKHTPGTYPICLGIAANCLVIPKVSAIRIMLYSYSSNVIAAGVRLGVIQHFNGQKILTAIAGTVNALSIRLSGRRSIDDIWQLTPLTDIFQMNHERLDSKMFIT